MKNTVVHMELILRTVIVLTWRQMRQEQLNYVKMDGYKNSDMVEALFDRGANVNIKGSDGYTALSSILSASDPPANIKPMRQIVGYLLRHGASVKSKTALEIPRYLWPVIITTHS